MVAKERTPPGCPRRAWVTARLAACANAEVRPALYASEVAAATVWLSALAMACAAAAVLPAASDATMSWAEATVGLVLRGGT